MEQGVEIHPLTNHVHRHDQTDLSSQTRHRSNVNRCDETMFSPHGVPLDRTCRTESWWSTWCRAVFPDPGVAWLCLGRWCWRGEPSAGCGGGSSADVGALWPQTPAAPAPSNGSANTRMLVPPLLHIWYIFYKITFCKNCFIQFVLCVLFFESMVLFSSQFAITDGDDPKFYTTSHIKGSKM